MKQSIIDNLEKIVARVNEIATLLLNPEVTNNITEYTKLNKEYSELLPISDMYNKYKATNNDLTVAKTLLSDPDMSLYAEQEIPTLSAKIDNLEIELQKLLLPKDPNDEKNIFLEIRAGAGGSESTLFASDLFRMYYRFAERNQWQVEIISISNSDLGGYKEIIAKIIGNGVYSKLKFESGVHRVQRIPVTESQGRIHTSTCTVAIMAEADEVGEVELNPSDLKIDTYRASGAGGQHVNKTDSAIRITHLPTGIVVECQDDRSQHKNKAQALSLLAAKLKNKQIQEQQDQIASTRKLLIGTGDRSERIRTYNFPQGRVTDHRINLTLYKLDTIMDGDLFELTTALITEYQVEQLSSIGE